MKRLNLWICLVLLTLTAFVAACDKEEVKPEAPAAEEPAATTAEAPAEEAAPPAEQPAIPKAAVVEEGGKLDPPVKPEQLPEGAWYCDMGTAHWAAMKKPEDGKCPLCGMDLKEYHAAGHAAQKEKAVEAKPAHEHGEGEGDGHGHDDHDGHAH